MLLCRVLAVSVSGFEDYLGRQSAGTSDSLMPTVVPRSWPFHKARRSTYTRHSKWRRCHVSVVQLYTSERFA